jgi:membrane protein
VSAPPLTRARRSDAARFVRDVATAGARHRLGTHASAIAFRILVSLVPLVLLALGLLGALGLRDVWTDSLAPAVRDRVTAPVFAGIDYSVEKILSEGSAGLLAFASLLLLWELSRAVRSVMVALNEIHDVEETRSYLRILLVTLVLAAATGLCIVASTLAIVVLPRLAGGLARAGLTVVAYAIAIVLLGLVVALLVRYAPTEHPSPEWASAGSAVVVVAWLVASALFGWWAGSVASYRSAIGTLTFFLVLTAYTFTSAAIFLIGVEIDQRAQLEEATHT